MQPRTLRRQQPLIAQGQRSLGACIQQTGSSLDPPERSCGCALQRGVQGRVADVSGDAWIASQTRRRCHFRAAALHRQRTVSCPCLAAHPAPPTACGPGCTPAGPLTVVVALGALVRHALLGVRLLGVPGGGAGVVGLAALELQAAGDGRWVVEICNARRVAQAAAGSRCSPACKPKPACRPGAHPEADVGVAIPLQPPAVDAPVVLAVDHAPELDQVLRGGGPRAGGVLLGCCSMHTAAWQARKA